MTKLSIVPKYLIVWLCLAAGWAHAESEPAPPPLAVHDFFRLPQYDDAKLSPTGKYLAVAMRRDGKKIVTVLTLDTLAVASIVKFNEPNQAHHFHWANDERLLVSLATTTPKLDFPFATGELYAVNADGTNGLMVFGRRAGDLIESGPIKTRSDYRGVHRITSFLPDDPRHVLITTYDDNGGREQITNGATLDIYTGALHRVDQAPLRDAFLLADSAGVIRFAMGHNKNLDYELYYKQDARAAWTRVTSSAFGSGELIPIGFSAEPNKVFVLDNRSTSTRGLFVLDLTTGLLQEKFRDPRVDVDSVLVAQPDGVVYGARFVPAAVAYYTVDSAQPFANILRAAQARFPGAYIEITSWTRDHALALVHTISDRDAGTFYLYDARAGSFKYLLASRSWLGPERMAGVRAVDISARDGQLLQGFVTTPQNWTAPGPIVVIPHGGPHGAKDGPLFDDTAQLLAYNGYAVLTVNYRGSEGYGPAFKAAGFGQWGGVIQHDITDATRWAVASGLADPQRIAIFGTSFGAYAAMMNPILEPGLYRCAIGISGVYDLPLLFQTGDIKRRAFGLNYLRKVVGQDRATLESISPVHNARRVAVPVLLAHGDEDAHTPVVHARRLRDALLAAGDEVEYIEAPHEAHDFIDPDNRAALFQKILAFLQQHLAPPPPSGKSN